MKKLIFAVIVLVTFSSCKKCFLCDGQKVCKDQSTQVYMDSNGNPCPAL